MAKKARVVNVLVRGNLAENSGAPKIVGYIIEAEGKKHVFTKLEAIEFLDAHCDGEAENAVIELRQGVPYLKAIEGSLRDLSLRIDRYVRDEKGNVVVGKNGIPQTEIIPEFAAKFARPVSKKVSKANMTPEQKAAEEARKRAEKRAAVREFLAQQKANK